MNKAELYRQSNVLQRRDAKEAIEKFFTKFQFNGDGSEILLDIGCGSADVLLEMIQPKMPKKYKKLIGIDISEEMINYCKGKFENELIYFEKLDISDNILCKSIMHCIEFDCVTSFYCFHWIQNQRKALENIYSLLKPNGVCLLVFLAHCPIYDVYLELSKMEKYSSYYHDVKKYISPLHFDENSKETFSRYLKEIGFTKYNVDLQEKVFKYDDKSLLKASVKAVNPFIDRMPKHLQEENLEDWIQVLDSLDLCKIDSESGQKYYVNPYKLMVVEAYK